MHQMVASYQLVKQFKQRLISRFHIFSKVVTYTKSPIEVHCNGLMYELLMKSIYNWLCLSNTIFPCYIDIVKWNCDKLSK